MKYEVLNLCEEQADCFLIMLENDLGDSCNILVDGNKYFDKNIIENKLIDTIKEIEKIDYIVITHIDNDHLGGILSLYMNAEKLGISSKLKDAIVIYNYITKDKISYKQAEKFEKLLSNKSIIHTCREHYNNSNSMLKLHNSNSRNIVMFSEEKMKMNAYLTFLNPNKDGINKVISGYKLGRMVPKLINENSIAFILEFGGISALFLGDCYWGDVENKLSEIKNVNKIDLVKLPHHGAEENNKGIVDWALTKNCSKFLVSGKCYWDKKHPSENLVAEMEMKFNSELDKLILYTKVDIDNKFCIQENSIKLI